MKPFKAIAAMSENRVIGSDNRIPWHLPEDLRWFQKITSGQILVMGRRTFESLEKPLPDRETIVLSRTETAIPGVRVVSSLAELDLTGETREIFICGGAQVYAQALPLCSDLYLTLVKRIVHGDTYFPGFEGQFVPVETIHDSLEFRITHYRRSPA